MDVAALAALLRETAERHDHFEKTHADLQDLSQEATLVISHEMFSKAGFGCRHKSRISDSGIIPCIRTIFFSLPLKRGRLEAKSRIWVGWDSNPQPTP